MKDISYRSSPTCNHYLTCCDRHRLPGLAVLSNQLLQALRDFSHFLHFMVGDDIDVSAQHLLCQSRDFRLLLRHKLRVSSNDGDFGPHACEEVAELCSDVSSSNNGDALR